MTPEQRAALERAGFTVGPLEEMLGLSAEESVEIEARVQNSIEVPPPPCSVCGEPMLLEQDIVAHVLYYRPGGLPALAMFHRACVPVENEAPDA